MSGAIGQVEHSRPPLAIASSLGRSTSRLVYGQTWTDHATLTANDGVRNGWGVYRNLGYTFTDSNLTPGAVLRYRVMAVNGAGRGAPSARVNGVAGTYPGAPENVKMTVSWGLVALNWDQPKSIGGTPVTQSKIEVWKEKSPFAAPGGDGYWWPLATIPGGSGSRPPSRAASHATTSPPAWRGSTWTSAVRSLESGTASSPSTPWEIAVRRIG
ncbi:hypothetical protein AKJ09_09272 [Labilithrix luteola]|uniref:Fibronectin type-III domain-containing protein n=1 Tax=Labilithrix luteola TaxID=1391654 RepID=A0A0K1QA40_9BACT|nr:hypothetical protein [Labilithrix luteola]AKV02609.1 hypothetical protein AKJ09_09272 [Labilithrix luteola]